MYMCRIKSYFSDRDHLNCSQIGVQSHLSTRLVAEIVMRYILRWVSEKKTPGHHKKTEHFKALTKSDNSSAIADQVKTLVST